MKPFNVLHQSLLNQGVYLGPSGYEVGFVSAAHSKTDLDEAAAKFKVALDEVFAG